MAELITILILFCVGMFVAIVSCWDKEYGKHVEQGNPKRCDSCGRDVDKCGGYNKESGEGNPPEKSKSIPGLEWLGL